MEHVALVGLGLGNNDLDSILAKVMFAAIGLAAGALLFLYCRHRYRKRRARRP